MSNTEPLWKMMRDEFRRSTAPEGDAWVDRHGFAAEIRAIADAVPDEFYGAGGVRRWLLDEADRAEQSNA